MKIKHHNDNCSKTLKNNKKKLRFVLDVNNKTDRKKLLRDIVIKNSKKLWFPPFRAKYKYIRTNSCFNIKIIKSTDDFFPDDDDAEPYIDHTNVKNIIEVLNKKKLFNINNDYKKDNLICTKNNTVYDLIKKNDIIEKSNNSSLKKTSTDKIIKKSSDYEIKSISTKTSIEQIKYDVENKIFQKDSHNIIVGENAPNIDCSNINDNIEIIDNYECINNDDCNSDNNKNKLEFKNIYYVFKSEVKKSEHAIIYPDARQKDIIQLWFDACTKMYNLAIRYLKSKTPFHKLPELRRLFIITQLQKKSTKQKLSSLQKDISKMVAEIGRIMKYIKVERNRTKSIIDTYNAKMIRYKDIKIELKKKKKEYYELSTRFNKDTKIYDDQISNLTTLFDYKRIRTYELIEERNKIINDHIYNNDVKNTIYVHIIDQAINHACTSFKSATTNYIEGNVEKFRIRYWKNSRNKKMFEIEGQYNGGFTDAELRQNQDDLYKGGIIGKTILGRMPMKINRSSKWEDYILEKKHSAKVYYDRKLNQYSITVTITVDVKTNSAVDGSFIGIDPGIRKFMTCITMNEAIQFATTLSMKIRKILIMMDKNERNTDISNSTRRRRNARHSRRIENLVDETHWKVANYIAQHYKTVYIGKLNVQSIMMSKTLNRMTKRIGMRMKHCEFRQRLKYKCEANGAKYVEVDERYTSKTCSICGWYNEDLGDSKVYKCLNCGTKVDRDVGAARCITIVNTI